MNLVLLEKDYPLNKSLQLVEGDLTQETTDAIVNAANAQLRQGGGVAGAITRRGGPEIQAESDAWVRQHGPVSHDSPAYTGAGSLLARYVIHAVGPVWGEGDEDAKLESAVRGSLRLADKLELRSIALPAISTGIYGFPLSRAAHIILMTIQEYLLGKPARVEQVRVVLYGADAVAAFKEAWEEVVGT